MPRIRPNALVLLLAYSACAPAALAGEAEWLCLTGDDHFRMWQAPTGEWTEVGSVALDPSNARLLISQPGQGVMVNGRLGKTDNLVSKAEFRDVEAHVEFLIPEGSNSGVKFMGLYEIQIADSHGIDRPSAEDCGGIYPRAREEPKYHHIDKGFPPRVNAARPAGEWQTLDVTFRGPRFDAQGKKTTAATFVKVVLNGKTIHENVAPQSPTGSAWLWKAEVPDGPLLLQADHGLVAFRSVRIRPLAAP